LFVPSVHDFGVGYPKRTLTQLHNPDIDWSLRRISSKSKKEKKKYIQPHILGFRAFARAAKKNIAFAIYATLMSTSTETGV
jgi:hypothetical protein